MWALWNGRFLSTLFHLHFCCLLFFVFVCLFFLPTFFLGEGRELKRSQLLIKQCLLQPLWYQCKTDNISNNQLLSSKAVEGVEEAGCYFLMMFYWQWVLHQTWTWSIDKCANCWLWVFVEVERYPAGQRIPWPSVGTPESQTWGSAQEMQSLLSSWVLTPPPGWCDSRVLWTRTEM